MTADLEREAREAAEKYKAMVCAMPNCSVHSKQAMAFEMGYIAAATAREREIEELRAKVAELEERAAQWVPESGLKSLMDQGWTEFYNDKRGNEPRLWLMVPPIPLPEGEK